MRLAVGELGVDVFYHGEHHAGHDFHFFFIARPVVGNVAVVAHHAQAGRGLTHGTRCEFRFGEHFQVRVGALRRVRRTASARGVHPERRGLWRKSRVQRVVGAFPYSLPQNLT